MVVALVVQDLGPSRHAFQRVHLRNFVVSKESSSVYAPHSLVAAVALWSFDQTGGTTLDWYPCRAWEGKPTGSNSRTFKPYKFVHHTLISKAPVHAHAQRKDCSIVDWAYIDDERVTMTPNANAISRVNQGGCAGVGSIRTVA